jgi:hypothetical protein
VRRINIAMYIVVRYKIMHYRLFILLKIKVSDVNLTFCTRFRAKYVYVPDVTLIRVYQYLGYLRNVSASFIEFDIKVFFYFVVVFILRVKTDEII